MGLVSYLIGRDGRAISHAAWLTLLVAAFVLIIAVVHRPSDAPGPEERAAELVAALKGIPQDGFTLGRADAPATLTAYVDTTTVPTFTDAATFEHLLEAYVRPGRLRLQLRTAPSVDTLGTTDDGIAVARALQAAGLQDRLWSLHAVLIASYIGYFDDDQLRTMARQTPGLDLRRLLAERGSERITKAIARARTLAAQAGGTLPRIELQTGTSAVPVALTGDLGRALERALAGSPAAAH